MAWRGDESVTCKTTLVRSPGLSDSNVEGPAAEADSIFMTFSAVRHTVKAISKARAVQAKIQVRLLFERKAELAVTMILSNSNVQALPRYRVKK